MANNGNYIPDFVDDEPHNESMASMLTDHLRTFVRAAVVVGAGAVAFASIPWPKGERPYFMTTKIEGCLVSDDYKWVYGTGGIDDLVIQNVTGVRSESGEGSECLAAVKKRIIFWANHDKIPLNDINSRDLNPIIRDDQPYAVPLSVREA